MTSSLSEAGTSMSAPGAVNSSPSGGLDVGQAVDVELEDLGCVLHAKAVTGAFVLVDANAHRNNASNVTALVPQREAVRRRPVALQRVARTLCSPHAKSRAGSCRPEQNAYVNG